MLVYFAVAKLGDKPIDGKTDVNPEGLTAAYGLHAAAISERLQRGGLSCKVCAGVGWRSYVSTVYVHVPCGTSLL